MKWFSGLALGAMLAGGAFLVFDYFSDALRPGRLFVTSGRRAGEREAERLAERIREAEARAHGVKGLYMTATVANDPGRAAARLRDDIIALLETSELDGLVIDVKETDGGLVITDQLEELIRALRARGVWVIARQVVFKDSSQEQAHPEWYIKRKSGGLWRDRRGGSWLDPASREVWAYQLEAAKAASEAGFDEIQFDYIRFPSDGDVRGIAYPVYDGKRPKYEIMRDFFRYLHDELKAYRPELILSADLFGYVALEAEDLGIGQRLVDIGENFDYVSLMVYPSHYYGGFAVPADPVRNLPALAYPYRSADMTKAAVSHPDEVVYRTLLIAEDILAGRATTSDRNGESSRPRPGGGEIATATTSSIPPRSPSSPVRRARLRPWLQDFDLAVDSTRGIHYDAAKVRAQIEAAEAAGASGWLLWSPDNVYTRAALKSE